MVFDVEAKEKKRKTIGEISKFQIQRKKQFVRISLITSYSVK